MKEEKEGVRYLWYGLLPVLIWVVVSVVIMLLKYLVVGFPGWNVTGVLMASLFVLSILAGLVFYYRAKLAGEPPKRERMLMTPEEATRRIIQYFRETEHNSFNFRVDKGFRMAERLVNVGAGKTPTEVYLRRGVDGNPAAHNVYYVGVRADEPESVSWMSFPQELGEVQEEEVFDKIASQLAKIPARVRETRRVTDSPYTGVREEFTTREPLDEEERKEAEEAKKEDLDAGG